VEVVASLSQGRTAAAQCGLFTHKSVLVIFEPSCMREIVFHGPKRTWSIILVNISGAPDRPKANLSYWKDLQGMIM